MRQSANRMRRPRWSVRTSFLTGVGLVAAITPVVLLVAHKSIWQELEIVTLTLSLLMFAYLWIVLYLGVRFDKAEGFSINWPRKHPRDLLDVLDFTPMDSGGFFTEAGTEAGLPGMVIGFLLDILVSLVLALIISALIWLGLNAAIAVVFAVFLPLFYFYRRSLRYVVARGRKCRRKWGKSALYAGGATIMYSVWFYLIFIAAQHVSRLRTP